MDKWVQSSIVAGSLLAGSGVFYHYVVYVPERDRARSSEISSSVVAAPAPIALEQCRQAARLLHDITWASACMTVAEETEAKHFACTLDREVMADPKRGRTYCDRLWGERDDSSECSLPDDRAAKVNAILHDNEAKCLAESRRRDP